MKKRTRTTITKSSQIIFYYICGFTAVLLNELAVRNPLAFMPTLSKLYYTTTSTKVRIENFNRQQSTTSSSNTILNLIMPEYERVEGYHHRNYTWPLQNFVPNTTGWKTLMERRFSQIENIPADMLKERYYGYIQVLCSAFVVPNITENGWGLGRAPDDLMHELRKGIREGIPNARLETGIDIITGEPPLFIDRPDLTSRVLDELKPLHEEWAQMPLIANTAYGFRLYRNESSLLMHLDKPDSHVVSCILHIDHSEDSEPWPIVIEDFQGHTNEVVLESGDILFYESSKCFHGRPKKFNGSWYTSVFVHYSPVAWDNKNLDLESHYAVPPDWWHEKSFDPSVPRLEMVGTGVREPDEEHGWSGLAASLRWEGGLLQQKSTSSVELMKTNRKSFVEAY